MAKKTELVAVEAKDLQVIEYRGKRVATTEQLAAGYGTTVIRIQQNHTRNANRFVEGKHFFKISGNELKSFRLSLNELVNKHTTSLILWTERGAANHAKILETDQAWEYYNDLTELYFTQRDAKGLPAPVELSRWKSSSLRWNLKKADWRRKNALIKPNEPKVRLAVSVRHLHSAN